MKSFCTVAALLLAARPAQGQSPIGKVLQMLSDLQGKIIKEGEASQKIYEEYSEWCEDRSSSLSNEITTGKSDATGLRAAIAHETATSATLTMKIQDLAGSIAVDEADLKAATEIRTAEAGVFAKSEKDLVETVDMLQRAVVIIEKEMKGGASMVQLKNAGSIAQALGALVQASAISSADASKLTGLIQSSAGEDDEPGAPASSVYESHSGDIVQTLSNLLDQAEQQLADCRNKETADIHNFELLKQSLVDELKYGNKEIEEAKKNLAASGEGKSKAEGDLGMTSKALDADVESKEDLHHACMTKAQDFEAETKSRGEELKALAEARKVIKETTSGADDISYSSASFVQVESNTIRSGADLANYEAVRFVRDLARKEKSSALAQLAQRMASAMRNTAGATDPFGKVKVLIRDMIVKLESEAGADATEKAWCDRNLADTRQSKAEKGAEIDKLSTRISTKSARSAQLKEEVAALQNALARLAKAQADMNKLRSEEHAAYVSNKADMEKGLEGVKLALKILSDYYASDKEHEAAQGAGEGIIGLLEVVESDFSKGLAEISSAEESAVASYKQESKENEIEKTTKDQDVRYKTKESTDLDRTSAEFSSDRSTVQSELSAVEEYLAKVEQRCVARAETYAERKARFEAELAGLKEALRILQDEVALLQKRSTRKQVLRGGHLMA